VVEAAVGKLKNGKAAGIDNIPGELLRKGGEETIAILLKICNEVWLLGKWPQSWTSSIVVPIPKKGNLKVGLSKLQNNKSNKPPQ